jgi:ABC-type Fe3+-hydroxamate transport system substrate-binding protein
MRFRRVLLRFTLLLPALVLSAACGESPPTPAPNTVSDDLGRSVTVGSPVQRTVSLAPNLTEIAFAAGAGSTLAAVTTSGDFPPPVDTLPHVSALPVDFEAVAAHDPGLIVATDQINAPKDAETFDALGLPVYFFSFATLADIPAAIRTVGRLVGTEAAARDSAAALEQAVDALRARTAPIPDDQRPHVLVLVGDETLYSFGQGSYVHTLVELAGGRSITANIDNQAPTLSEEYVLTQKPDVILGLWGEQYDPDRLLTLHPTWDVVPAVQNDRVYSLPAALFARPGPRVLQGARQLARRLHPDRFSAQTATALSSSPSTTPVPSP